MTQGILLTFMPAVENLEVCALMASVCPKDINMKHEIVLNEKMQKTYVS